MTSRMAAEAVYPGFAIQRSFPAGQRDLAAQIYWEAFGPKLRRVMGPDHRALDFLRRGLRPDHCYAAIDDSGQLIGLAGFKTPYGSFSGGSRRSLNRVYGSIGAAWRATLLRLLASEVDNERFLVDGIAVTEAARGRGVGTALLAALCTEARQRGYEAIRLEVVDTNQRARALYEREGFTPVSTDKLGPLRLFFGFNAATVMVRPLERGRPL